MRTKTREQTQGSIMLVPAARGKLKLPGLWSFHHKLSGDYQWCLLFWEKKLPNEDSRSCVCEIFTV